MTVSHHDATSRQFGTQASAYVASTVHSAGPDLDRIEAIARDAGGRALDLGCGGGHVAYRVAPHVAEVVACDLSADMLAAVAAEAEARGLGNITTRQAPAERLPFADASFDLTFCRMSAHHWRDWDAGLREARRVTRAGGRAVFIDPVALPMPLADTHLQAIELLRDPSHVRDYSVAEWSAALGRAGFLIEAVATHRLRMEFASWIARMRTAEAHVAAILSLQHGASAEVRSALAIEPDGSFLLDVAMFELRAA
ncbi:class I SAM-dependent methyltransferase [Sphingomonas crocodyli]|uniref:Class I SAM-dependent methyltransferase n=1 Tax=Sphingomonas crocodyli TaxID=1979270 RepID=A0A437M5Q0_9SPHN|nr:class I SAM-dependent methyltransferase [Sphingomonas crocodyli]RVT93061.1 class I SAM-dependent methyltransferase [Sphingomonas crocodyli]